MKRRTQNDYLPVRRSRATDAKRLVSPPGPANREFPSTAEPQSSRAEVRATSSWRKSAEIGQSVTRLRPAHFFSFFGLFLFTIILYARPAEFYPSSLTNSIALIVGIVMLSFFIPTQLSKEGTLSAPLPEVKRVVLLCFLGLLSVAFAMSPPDAWNEFNSGFIRAIVIFVVIVNAVRTEARLKALFFLGLAAGVWLSVVAINDYRLGLATVEGYRVSGRGDGIFGNSNDMALHLVTMVPIAIALMFSSRRLFVKTLYGSCAGLMLAAIVLSYSRGAFLGLVAILIFLIIKLGRENRLKIAVAASLVGAALLVFAPGNYGIRLLSIFVPSLDPVRSVDARRGELFRSLYVALRHPVLGVGMGNYASQMSFRGLVTHNSYTQVASEMGLAALVCYVSFIVTPLKRLGQIARDTLNVPEESHFYYLAVGLQATLIAYMVSSFFLAVAYSWYIFYLVGYAVCLRRLYESETGRLVVLERKTRDIAKPLPSPHGSMVPALSADQGRS